MVNILQLIYQNNYGKKFSVVLKFSTQKSMKYSLNFLVLNS